MMDLLFFATVVFNLFLIVDPVACMPLFLSITKDNTPAERRRMVQKATWVAFVTLVFFALVGRPILGYFDVGVPALRIAGGVLLFIIGIEMLYGRVSRTEATEPEVMEAVKKQDVSITPLAIPLLAGPGAIAAVMLFSGQAEGFAGTLLVVTAILVVMLISWLLLSLSQALHRMLGDIGIKVIARVMGLLLIFMAAQFVIDGLTGLGIAAPLV